VEASRIGLSASKCIIPLAEHTGLINPIGEWVLKAACSQNKAWQNASLPSVRNGVNISVNQLCNPGIVEKVT